MTKREEIRALRDEVAGLREMLGMMQIQLAQIASHQTIVIGDPMPQPMPFAPMPQPWVSSPNICQSSQTTPMEPRVIAWNGGVPNMEAH